MGERMDINKMFGGYEGAKKYLDNLKNIPMQEQTEDTITWLPELLLKYRMENNIFEEFDKVVLVGSGTKNVLLEIIFHKYTNDLYRVKVLSTGELGPIHRDNIRHATPKEIEQGFRDE